MLKQIAVLFAVVLLAILITLIMGCADVDTEARIAAEVKARVEALAQVGALNQKQDASAEAGDGGLALTGGQGDSITQWLSVAGLTLSGFSIPITILVYVLFVKPWMHGRRVMRNGGSSHTSD